MIGCAYHCRACNGCFGSLKAFDAHRQFLEGHEGDWDYRVCVEPLDDKRFAPKTTVGVCNLARPKKRATVIWSLAREQQRWAERKGVARVSNRKPKSGLDHREAA